MWRWLWRALLALLVLVLGVSGVMGWRYAQYAPADPAVAPDPSALAYFHADYAGARADFLTQGARLAARWRDVERFAVPVASNGFGQDLFVDAVYVPAQRSPRRLLILSSGVHGVEGGTGSAVQRMFMRELMNDETVADTGILLLHALNPWGFAQSRRFTARNVDLNRNASTSASLYRTVNAGYPMVDPLINPPAPVNLNDWQHKLFLWRSVGMIAAHGMPVLRQAVLQGQYQYPRGIYFGGQALEPQLADLGPRLKTLLDAYPMSMSIDLHTGYGARGRLHVFLNPPGEERVRQGLETVFGEYPIDWGSGADFYTVTGDVTSWIGSLRSNGLHLPAVFEYGTLDSQSTLGAIKSLQITVLENQGFQNGWATPGDEEAVKQAYREMFYPSSPAWRTQVIQSSRTLLRQLLRRLPEAQPPG
jgi:hypothetical protein